MNDLIAGIFGSSQRYDQKITFQSGNAQEQLLWSWQRPDGASW